MSQRQATIHDWTPPRTITGLPDALQNPLPKEGWWRFMSKPTTQPRWILLLTYGGLTLTILAGVVSYGRSAGRMETALSQARAVPGMEASIQTITSKLDEISKKQDVALERQDRRIANMESQMVAVQRLEEKVNALTSTNGSAWALSQSNSIKLGKLEGMLETMQRLQQQKDKQ